MALVVLLIIGCSNAQEIPRQKLDAEEYRKPGSYRIKLRGWNEYNARRFSMTDSTVVIEELLTTDDHYKVKRHEMPIVVPLNEVEYIGVMETNVPVTFAAVAAVGTVVAFFALLIITFPDEGWGN